MGAAPKKESRTHRGSRFLPRVIVLQAVGVAAFVFALVVGERARPALVALYLPRQPLLVVGVALAIVAAFARRRALFAFQSTLCLVVLVPVMGLQAALPRSPFHAEKTIRLATYNVYFGKLGRAQLLDEIAAMEVDILVLQAAFGSMGERLRERLPDRSIRQDGELVIVSRFPIRDVDVPEPLEGDVKSMFVGYLLETPSGPLRVFGFHPFSPRSALEREKPWTLDVAQREAQVGAVVAASARPGPPFVIAGDTNLPGFSSIRRHHFRGLYDAFDEVGFGLGYTFPAKRPWMRIDRVLSGAGVRFIEARVGPQGASDHRPLFAVLELVSVDVAP